MAVQNATILKSYYETGDKPTQQQFEDLIDSLQQARDNASTALATATSAQVVATTALSDAGQRVLRVGDTMTGPLVINQGTIAAAASPISITSTWNNGAVVFGVITADVTDTASASTSSLIELMVDSVDRVLIRKSGFTQLSRYAADNSPQIIELRKRGQTGDADGVIASGIIVSRIDSSGWNSAAYVSGAQISMVSTEAYSGSVNGTLIRFGTTATGANSVTSVMDVHTTGLTMLNSTPIRAVDGAIGTPSYTFATQTTTGFYYTSNTLNLVALGASRVALNSGGLLLISDSLPLVFGAASDAYLRREAANQLAMHNSTNAQTFRIYGTRTDASNYERLVINHDGSANINFISEAAGSGTLRRFNFSAADFIHTLTVSNTSGTRVLVGASHTIAPAAGSGSFNALRLTYVINAGGAQTGTVSGVSITATETALNGFIHRLFDCRVDSTPIFLVNATGSMLIGTAGAAPSGMTLGIWQTAGADLSANPSSGSAQWGTTAGEWLYRSAAASEGAGQNNRVHNRTETVTGSGTDYALTAATAAVDFGTTDPIAVLPTAGTYLLIGVIQFVAGATGDDEYRAKFRNTTDATDIGKEIQQTITTASGLATIVIQETVTVTATKNVQLFAHNQTAARGSITSTGTSITYVRLY